MDDADGGRRPPLDDATEVMDDLELGGIYDIFPELPLSHPLRHATQGLTWVYIGVVNFGGGANYVLVPCDRRETLARVAIPLTEEIEGRLMWHVPVMAPMHLPETTLHPGLQWTGQIEEEALEALRQIHLLDTSMCTYLPFEGSDAEEHRFNALMLVIMILEQQLQV